jgi:hypothetical protein
VAVVARVGAAAGLRLARGHHAPPHREARPREILRGAIEDARCEDEADDEGDGEREQVAAEAEDRELRRAVLVGALDPRVDPRHQQHPDELHRRVHHHHEHAELDDGEGEDPALLEERQPRKLVHT